MEDRTALPDFEQAVLPHLDAAYNLARWLLRDEHDAQDAVQEAFLRAYRFFHTFHGGEARAWVLTIVRNVCHTALAARGAHPPTVGLDETMAESSSEEFDPESLLAQEDNVKLVRQAIDELPPEFREAIVLRELEGLSYKQIADVAHVQIGTVMSRLARARQRLCKRLSARAAQGELK